MKKAIMILALVMLIPASSSAQGSAFSFQGRLNDGTNPANGRYDLQFRLFDGITGGNPVGPLVSRPNTTLINGVFSVTLDFGASAFANPGNVFIEISVRPNGSPNAFTVLGPRQQLTTVPFSLRSANATNADSAANADLLGGIPRTGFVTHSEGAQYFILNLPTTNVQPNANFNITGDGGIGGQLTVGGDAHQSSFKGGLVKAMAYINADGTIRSCFNGVNPSSIPPCGFVVNRLNDGDYLINFGFSVSQRFASVTPIMAPLVTIVASVRYGLATGNTFEVFTDITDVDHVDSAADNAFMIIVY
jgi:hypothetical protein